MTGTVLEKRSGVGQRAMAGDEVYRIADLREVWVLEPKDGAVPPTSPPGKPEGGR